MYCRDCGAQIVDPHELMVVVSRVVGLRPLCRTCYADMHKGWFTETLGPVNHSGFSGVLLRGLLVLGALGAILWSKIGNIEGVGSLEFVLFLASLLGGSAVLFLFLPLYRRWRCWVDYEVPLMRNARRP